MLLDIIYQLLHLDNENSNNTSIRRRSNESRKSSQLNVIHELGEAKKKSGKLTFPRNRRDSSNSS
jgi:hypothetical protein